MSTWCREDSTISVEQICSFFFSLKSSFLLLVSCLFSFSLDNIYISYVLFLWKGLDLINVNITLPPHCLNLLTSLSTMMHCQHGDERKHVLTTSDHVSHTQENEAFIRHSCHFYQTHNTCRCHDSLACSFPTGKLFRYTLTDRRADLPTPWICHSQSQILAVTYMGNKEWHAERRGYFHDSDIWELNCWTISP